MEYYSVGSGSNYTVYVTDGIDNPTPVQYNFKIDINDMELPKVAA